MRSGEHSPGTEDGSLYDTWLEAQSQTYQNQVSNGTSYLSDLVYANQLSEQSVGPDAVYQTAADSVALSVTNSKRKAPGPPTIKVPKPPRSKIPERSASYIPTPSSAYSSVYDTWWDSSSQTYQNQLSRSEIGTSLAGEGHQRDPLSNQPQYLNQDSFDQKGETINSIQLPEPSDDYHNQPSLYDVAWPKRSTASLAPSAEYHNSQSTASLAHTAEYHNAQFTASLAHTAEYNNTQFTASLAPEAEYNNAQSTASLAPTAEYNNAESVFSAEYNTLNESRMEVERKSSVESYNSQESHAEKSSVSNAEDEGTRNRDDKRKTTKL